MQGSMSRISLLVNLFGLCLGLSVAVLAQAQTQALLTVQFLTLHRSLVLGVYVPRPSLVLVMTHKTALAF